jgi:hypothetical protein
MIILPDTTLHYGLPGVTGETIMAIAGFKGVSLHISIYTASHMGQGVSII